MTLTFQPSLLPILRASHSTPFISPLRKRRRCPPPHLRVWRPDNIPKHQCLNCVLPSTVESLLSNELFSRFCRAALFNVPLYACLRYKLLFDQEFLTDTGLLHALYLGLVLWGTNGVGYYTLVFSFLLVGGAATRAGKFEKERLGIAEQRGGRRGAENLWGAAGVAALTAISIHLAPSVHAAHALRVGFVASVATKAADTASSEIGKAYGRTTVLSNNWFKRVPKGTEGAISLEGTAAGVTMSLAFAAVGVGLVLQGKQEIQAGKAIGVVVVASVIANYIESVIGATVQKNVEWLTNEQVNFINTLIGCLLGIGLSYLVI